MPLPRSAPAALAAVLLSLCAACASTGEEPSRDAATEQPGRPSSAAPPPAATDASAVVLSRAGVGVADFGDDADGALASLRAALGPPDVLTKWLPMEHSRWGRCPGDEVRGAKWGDLWVLFADATPLGQEPHLSAWLLGQTGVQGRSDLTTAEGLGVGSTVDQLKAVYGDRLAMEPYELGARFTVAAADGAAPGPAELGGVASGVEDDDTVRTMRGGLRCTTS